MSLTPKAGVYAVIDGVPQVTAWSINDTIVRNVYRTSATKGGTGRTPGAQDWNGSFTHLGGVPFAMPGEVIPFIGFTGPDSGVPGGTGDTFEGDIMIDSVAITWDWATLNMFRTVVNFSGDSPLVQDTGIYSDASLPPVEDSPSGIWLRAGAFDATPAAILADDATRIRYTSTATLTITSQNQTRLDSDSQGWTQRLAGGPDWNLTFTQNRIDRTFLAKGDVRQLVLPINATQYFALKWGIVGDFTGITADNESQVVIAQSGIIEMQAHHETAGVGSIVLPGEVTPWWPAA